METIDILAFPAGAPEPQRHPLPLAGPGSRCAIGLRCLPGASYLHLLLQSGEKILYRAEIPALGDERVSLTVGWNPSGDCAVDCPGREILRLPENPSLPPTVPIVLGESTDGLDLALVIDGTCRFFSSADGRSFTGAPLLGEPRQWALEVEKLCRFGDTLAEGCPDFRIAVLAYGDRPIANTTAPDLQPRYRLFPADPARRGLRPWKPDSVRDELLALPPTSGGDFVDALGEGLAACDGLYWRPRSRKLVLVFGDSPGHSILYPIPRGGDAGARSHDVDAEALRLFRRGVALATVYHAPDPGWSAGLIAVQRELQDAARQQYRRLAALPELAFAASGFDGTGAAKTFLDLAGLIGRGGCYGEWVGVSAEAD